MPHADILGHLFSCSWWNVPADKKHIPKYPKKETLNYLFIYNFNFVFTPWLVIVLLKKIKQNLQTGKCYFLFPRDPAWPYLACLLFWVTIWIQRPAAICAALVRVKLVLYFLSSNRKEAHFREEHLCYHHVITSCSVKYKCKCKDWFYLPLYISFHCEIEIRPSKSKLELSPLYIRL